MRVQRTVRSIAAIGIVSTVLAGCSGGGGGSGTSAPPTALTPAVERVPIAGQFLADCTDTALAVISGFVEQSPLPNPPIELPSLEEVLEAPDASAIPVIGGLVPQQDLLSSTLVPISAEDALAMIPDLGLPTSLPVVGAVPITCSDLPLPSGELPVPTDVLGLIPVFGEAGDPVAVVLATVSALQEDAPNPSDTLALPVGTETLPAPIGPVVRALLGLLGL